MVKEHPTLKWIKIHLQRSIIEFRELSHSIKDLSSTANTPAVWKNVGMREFSNAITEISNGIRELYN